MLVLQLELDDTVELWLEDGRKIIVRHVAVRSEGRVRLGFEANPEIRILRAKVADSIRRENREAAKVVANP